MGFLKKVGRQIEWFKQQITTATDGSDEANDEAEAKEVHRADEPQPIRNQNKDVDDPRRTTDEDRLKADTSEAALADESGEAVGPDPEQVQTEATEPKVTPEEDTSHMEADRQITDKAVTDETAGPIDENDIEENKKGEHEPKE